MDHIKDKTYRRKASITEPNTRFDTAEWDILGANSFDGIGSHSSALSTKNSAFESFKMFPNPSTDILNIQLSVETLKVEVGVYDHTGRKIIVKKLSPEDSKLNVSKLTTGIYIIRVLSDNKVGVQTLIKS